MEEKQTQQNIETTNMYKALQDFLIMDMKIKENMFKLAPNELDEYNEESRIEYSDKLADFVNEIQIQFNDISKEFDFGSEVNEAIDNNFKKYQKTLLIGKYKEQITQEIYEKVVSKLRENLVEEVKDKCVGYTVGGKENFIQLINKSKSINELLHVFHSYIMNNEKILQSMPVIETKSNKISGDNITLYGTETELSKKLFYDFPSNLDCGYTDIISIKNRILMMIRDRGHALTIDIDNTEIDKDILVKYFIPKLCNLDMIKKLPGISKISSNGAIGMFESNEEELSKKIYEFIEKVPTDIDMDFSNTTTILEQKEPETYFFDENDVKQVVMKKGENGIRIERVLKLQQIIKEEIDKETNKFKNTKEKQLGGDNDRESRN